MSCIKCHLKASLNLITHHALVSKEPPITVQQGPQSKEKPMLLTSSSILDLSSSTALCIMMIASQFIDKSVSNLLTKTTKWCHRCLPISVDKFCSAILQVKSRWTIKRRSWSFLSHRPLQILHANYILYKTHEKSVLYVFAFFVFLQIIIVIYVTPGSIKKIEKV